jgi:hypothetical protein
MQIDNKTLQNVLNFEYFGTAVTSKYCIRNEIKSSLDSGTAYYYSV